jgi:hypothetical protein
MSDDLHSAVCQSVAILNVSTVAAQDPEIRKAHQILRQALAEHYMNQPVTETERDAIAKKHRKEPK